MPGMQTGDKNLNQKPGNFGPVPGGSTILWQTDHFIMYADSKHLIWRYMHEFHARWPVEFNPSIRSFAPVQEAPKEECRLTPAEIEDLI